jgi:peptide-methionine (S)-S-oxide reductase
MKILMILGMTSALMACQTHAQEKSPDMTTPPDVKTETAVLGAGCFWCVEAVFQDLKGVYKVESGYTGGHVKNPTYREVSSGATGHAEVGRITFDPNVISFETLLKVFWTTHDPTTLNRQGADAGTQYRSAIYYNSDAQKVIAEKSKREVAPTLWDNPIVTEVSPAVEFYMAEDYHQNYYNTNPNAGYCRVVINPKVRKLREHFADLLKDENQ